MEMVDSRKISLDDLVEKVNADRDSFLITNSSGQSIIAIALEDFESIMETVHLLSSKANVEHVFKSLNEYKNGILKSFSLEQLDEFIK